MSLLALVRQLLARSPWAPPPVPVPMPVPPPPEEPFVGMVHAGAFWCWPCAERHLDGHEPCSDDMQLIPRTSRAFAFGICADCGGRFQGAWN